jgi:uncharacterized protein (TIGR04255 family)
MRGPILPGRINPDSILEALVEFRFEHQELPELLIGRLLDADLWAGYEQARLPTADIPQPIREMDVNLRYQPAFELRKRDGTRVAKIGGHVLSYHITGSYPGWAVFEPEIQAIVHGLIEKLKSSPISRVGFRYINVLRPVKHHVAGLQDTNIVLRVGEHELHKSVAVTYTRSYEPAHAVTVRIATPDLVTGNVEPGYSLLCDIDVATKTGHLMSGFDDTMQWIDKAHTLEKAEYFALLPDRVIEKLSATEGKPEDD